MRIKFSNIAPLISDCHVHYGQFREVLYNRETIVDWFDQLGIDKIGIMPMGSTQQYDHSKEEETLLSFPKNKFIPYLWVSPEMVDADPTLGTYLKPIYKLIKIHPYARKEWYKSPDKIRLVVEAAHRYIIPVMFHTGGWRGSNAIQFYKFCREYPEVTFILAHGKPLSQTLTVLKGTKNAFLDSSFVPIENIKVVCDAGMSDRIIFGTDFPVMKNFYPEIDIIDWYKSHVMELVKTFGESMFMKWANENFYKIIMKS